jgi:hypothetical protein
MSEHEADMTALGREWLAARVVLIVGFAIAIGFGGYKAYAWRNAIEQVRAQASGQISEEQGASGGVESGADAGALICHQALVVAQNFGVLPQDAKLAGNGFKPTDVTGRYSCEAASQSAKFTIAVDLVCRNLQDQRCVSLYNVTQNGGAVLFQRQG